MTAGASRIAVRGRLSAGERAAVTALIDRATDADGVAPLSEHVRLHLAHGGGGRSRNLLLYESERDELAGYAHLDLTDPAGGPSAELTVDPGYRRRGRGRELLGAVEAEAGGRLRLWAHGSHPGAAALAESLGYRKVRALWQMRRPLTGTIEEPRYPPDVTVRTFVPGQDEREWLRVNQRAFVRLPDQGGWQLADLRAREHEPWFDPAGFFLAIRAGRLVGFHWTKVHDRPPVGEVYVVGVDPDAQGLGLGRALTLTGLVHLRDRGLETVLLYVDEENGAAIRLYSSLGFTRWSTDVSFARESAER